MRITIPFRAGTAGLADYGWEKLAVGLMVIFCVILMYPIDLFFYFWYVGASCT
jgi:hypothetical protein